MVTWFAQGHTAWKSWAKELQVKILFIYSWETLREREAETQADGKAGSMQEAWRGTWSRVSRNRPWAEGGAKPLSHLGCPQVVLKPDCLNPVISLVKQALKANIISCFLKSQDTLWRSFYGHDTGGSENWSDQPNVVTWWSSVVRGRHRTRIQSPCS